MSLVSIFSDIVGNKFILENIVKIGVNRQDKDGLKGSLSLVTN